jgi:cation transport ATPase
MAELWPFKGIEMRRVTTQKRHNFLGNISCTPLRCMRAPQFSIANLVVPQITIIIAPSLPLALSIAVYYAIRRLKQGKIKVALPNSINIAGKVKMTVFDKTGSSN